jgi:hypothetical protein
MLLKGALCSLHTQQVRHYLHSVFPLLARSTPSNRAAALQQARVHEWQVDCCCAVCLQYLFTAHRDKWQALWRHAQCWSRVECTIKHRSQRRSALVNKVQLGREHHVFAIFTVGGKFVLRPACCEESGCVAVLKECFGNCKSGTLKDCIYAECEKYLLPADILAHARRRDLTSCPGHHGPVQDRGQQYFTALLTVVSSEHGYPTAASGLQESESCACRGVETADVLAPWYSDVSSPRYSGVSSLAGRLKRSQRCFESSHSVVVARFS